MSFETARATLGEEYFDVDRKYSWAGNGAFIMHDVLENRTMVQCIVAAVEKDPPRDRKRDLTREMLMDTLGSWLNGPIAEGVIDVSPLSGGVGRSWSLIGHHAHVLAAYARPT